MTATTLAFPLDDRALGLMITRESKLHAKLLFNNMREQTFALPQVAHIPAVQAIRAAGMRPMKRGITSFMIEVGSGKKRQQRAVSISRRECGRTVAILFEYGGYYHLWSQASAAKNDPKGANEFTTILCEVITELRPRAVYAANISRLIRDERHALDIQAAMIDHVDLLVLPEMTFKMEKGSMGTVMLTTMGQIAAMERNWIVQRTTTGRIFGITNGAWPYGKSSVPFGYKLSSKGKLKADPSKRAQVKAMLTILATNTPPRLMQEQLAAAGVTRPGKSSRTGNAQLVDTVEQASRVLNGLYSYIGLYVAGEYLFRLTNPIPAADEIAGVPVVRFPADTCKDADPGEIQVLVKAKPPEGGWAPRQILDAVAAQAVTYSRRLVTDHGRTEVRPLTPKAQKSKYRWLHVGLLPVGHAHGTDESARRRNAARDRKVVAPFTGRAWSDDEFHYELATRNYGRYEVHRWPLTRTRARLRPIDRPMVQPGETVGREAGESDSGQLEEGGSA